MLDEVAKASLVLAVMADGRLSVVVNRNGPRTREAGMRALIERLCEEDRAELFRLWNAPVHGRTYQRLKLS